MERKCGFFDKYNDDWWRLTAKVVMEKIQLMLQVYIPLTYEDGFPMIYVPYREETFALFRSGLMDRGTRSNMCSF